MLVFLNSDLQISPCHKLTPIFLMHVFLYVMTSAGIHFKINNINFPLFYVITGLDTPLDSTYILTHSHSTLNIEKSFTDSSNAD